MNGQVNKSHETDSGIGQREGVVALAYLGFEVHVVEGVDRVGHGHT